MNACGVEPVEPPDLAGTDFALSAEFSPLLL
jgi:hypothetical protein